MIVEKTIQGEFYFDPNDPIFLVHFPSFPVVPGSLIIDSFLKAIKKNIILPRNITIQSFKFIHFATPGKARYEIKFSDTQTRCFLYQNQTLIAKGLIKNET
jgi:3-hydroxymyristoyl/3-hydroxydecanoyl-(acyl carrier protein) dehydratase